MAWSLHLLVVRAKSHKEAVKLCEQHNETVYDNISDYQKILASINESNDSKVYDKNNLGVLDNRKNIAEINQFIKEVWLGVSIAEKKEDEIMMGLLEVVSKGKPIPSSAYWNCIQYLKKLKAKSETNVDNFNVLEHQFYPMEYDTNGVTHIPSPYDELPNSIKFITDAQKYVVFVSYHQN